MCSYQCSPSAPEATILESSAPEAFVRQVHASSSSGLRRANAPGGAGKDLPDLGKARNAQDITVLLLDDMLLTRECLALSINLCDRGVHVLTAASTSDARGMLRGDAVPDVILCNLGALAPSDADAAEKMSGIMASPRDTPVIVLSDREDGEAITEAFHRGVRGYISTSVGLSVALEAIRLVAAGGTFAPPSFLHRLIQGPASPGQEAQGQEAQKADRPVAAQAVESPVDGLTPRQLSVLNCIKEGKPNKIIAHELGMRESTVKVHVRSILKKLGATNRTEAVYRTLRNSEP